MIFGQQGIYSSYTPVVFSLSSWALKRKSLADWLVDELNQRYDAPRKIAQASLDFEEKGIYGSIRKKAA